jgi:hypothetical protein
MPTGDRRETALIKLFLSAYEDGAWAVDPLVQPDRITDGAIDGFVTRSSDGRRLAIEHTLIQPYLNDRKDFALFEKRLLTIQGDSTLTVPGRITWVAVHPEILEPGPTFNQVPEAIHEWLRDNVQLLPLGESWHNCPVRGGARESVRLYTRVFTDSRNATFRMWRFHENDTFGAVVDKALRDKLPKLTNTDADEWILLLEREQMLLDEVTILREIKSRRADFAGLNKAQIWFAETVFYERDGCVEFKRHVDFTHVQSLIFASGRLKMKIDDGVATIVERI